MYDNANRPFKSTGNLQDDNDIADELECQANKIRTVSVRYSRSLNNYTFMTTEECKVDDKAVVFTSGNWNVVTIMEVHDTPQLDNPNIQYTFLVQVIDRTQYDKNIAAMHEGYPKAGKRL